MRRPTLNAHQRAQSEDPWVMYLLVEKSTEVSVSDLLLDGAKAALAVELAYAQAPEHQQDFNVWWEQSFRKVTLRCKNANQLQTAKESAAGVQYGSVYACVPFQRSVRPEVFGKLQALNAQTTLPCLQEPHWPDRADITYFVLDAMGIGKQLAQIAHASLKLASDLDLDIEDVLAMSARVKICADKDMPTECTSSIRDAGLTEVAPGTRTVAVQLNI